MPRLAVEHLEDSCQSLRGLEMLGFPLLLSSTTLVWYQLWTTVHASGDLRTFCCCNQIQNRAIWHFLGVHNFAPIPARGVIWAGWTQPQDIINVLFTYGIDLYKCQTRELLRKSFYGAATNKEQIGLQRSVVYFRVCRKTIYFMIRLQ